MIKITFEYNEGQRAINFVDYCDQHHVECSRLNNDGFNYVVTLNSDAVAKLNKYLAADAPCSVAALDYIVSINECLLRELEV